MKAPCVGMQGKMLPSVTTEDDGDVLTVVNGEWQKAEASGGGGSELFIIEALFSIDGISSQSATYNEMLDNMHAGKILILKLYAMPKEYVEQFNMYYLSSYYDNGKTFNFYCSNANSGRQTVIVDQYNTWTVQ